jgi:hypothetical protein
LEINKMTNYNQPQNIEKQLALPGVGLEAIASTGPQPKARKGLRPRTYGIITAIVLTLGATAYGAHYVLNGVGGANSFSKKNVAESTAEGIDKVYDKVFKGQNDHL